jgi:hypothetical protein
MLVFDRVFEQPADVSESAVEAIIFPQLLLSLSHAARHVVEAAVFAKASP